MNLTRKINNELTIAGQISSDLLQQLAEEGYKTILNLRSPTEPGFLNDEQEKTENLGLCYVNIPTQVEVISLDRITEILQQVAVLPKPILLHCDTGMRAAAVAFMQVALKQGIAPEKAFNQATQFGLT